MSVPRRWTDDEMGVVVDTLESPVNEVAEMLGRSAKAIYLMRDKLRVGWSPTLMEWTEDDREFLRKTPHMNAAEVGKLLFRSRRGVEHERARLAKSEGIDFHFRSDPNEVGKRPLVAKTCAGCGLLLDATWFYRETTNGGYWRPRCARCKLQEPNYQNRKPRGPEASHAMSLRNSISRAKLQAITQEHAHRHGQTWLGSDDAILSNPDMTIFEKAMALQRTYVATNSRCAKGDYRSKIGRGDPQKVQWKILRVAA